MVIIFMNNAAFGIVDFTRIALNVKQGKNYLPMQRSMVSKSMDTQMRLGTTRFQKTRSTLEV
jgi:hypothetical protein